MFIVNTSWDVLTCRSLLCHVFAHTHLTSAAWLRRIPFNLGYERRHRYGTIISRFFLLWKRNSQCLRIYVNGHGFT